VEEYNIEDEKLMRLLSRSVARKSITNETCSYHQKKPGQLSLMIGRPSFQTGTF